MPILAIGAIFSKFDQVEKTFFWDFMFHKGSAEYLESFDIFWLKKYFELTKIPQVFKIQFLKPDLKHVTTMFIVQKQQFWDQIEIFLKTKYINGFKIFKGTFCVQILLKKLSIEASKYQKHTKFI